MTLTEMLLETGFPVSEAEFRSEVKPPYLVYEENTGTVSADSKVVYIEGTVSIYLAHSKSDSRSEETTEQVLDAHAIAYTKERTWIGGNQRVWLVTYSFDGKADY